MIKFFKLIVLITIIGIMSSGCASISGFLGKRQNDLENQSNHSVSSEITQYELESKAKVLIDSFNSSIEYGDCAKLSKAREEFMNNFASEDMVIEENMLTSECMCYLEEEGDKKFFLRCVEELKKICPEKKYLSKNTQFVLSLGKEFGASIDECEKSISANISEPMTNIFGGE